MLWTRLLSVMLVGAMLLGGVSGASVRAERVQMGGGPPAAAADHSTEGGSAAGAAHSAEQPNILEPQIPLAFWTLIVFLLLLLLLWRFAWGPLSKALHDREHYMEDSLRQAEHARSESERLLAEHRQLMEQANQQAVALLDDARRGAVSTAEEIRRTAQAEADMTLQRAHREIASAKDQALLDIWNRSADLAVSIAGKVLTKELGPDDHRRLVDQAMAELPQSPNGPGSRELAS